MPFKIGGARRRRLAGLAAGLITLAMAPAAHAADLSNPYNCTPEATLTQTFSAWGDYSQYTPVPNSGFEQGSTGWTLVGGASVVTGNEPWKVGGSTHSHALDLPANASAATAPMCVDETYPYFRLFAKKLSTPKATLKMDVLFFDSKGNVKATKPYAYSTAGSSWVPTGTVKIGLFTDKTTVAAAPVAFRFTAPAGTHWQIDDVYVDPMCRR